MPEWVLLDAAPDISPGQVRQYPLPDGRRVALCRTEDGTFHACDDACPHAGGPLGRGIIKADRIICPVHGWAFDLRTGQSDPFQPGLKLRLHEVRVTDGQVWIKPAEPPPPDRSDDLLA